MAVTSPRTPARAKRAFSVPESSFLVPSGAAPLTRTDLGSDGNGMARIQNWVEQITDGATSAAGRALTGEEGTISRNLMMRYRTAEDVLRAWIGLPVSDVDIEAAARRKLVFEVPDVGSNPVETNTFYYGLPAGNVAELNGGKVRSWNIDVVRNGDGGTTSGNIEYHFNWVKRTGSLPGGAAASEVKRIILDAATGNGSIVIPDSDLGSGGTVTVVPAVSAATLQGLIEAVAAVGSGNAVVAGSSLAYGYATPSAATASAGTATGAIAGDLGTTYWTTAGAWDDGATDIVWLQIDLGVARKIDRVSLHTEAYEGSPNTFRIRMSNDATFATSVIGYQQTQNGGGNDLAAGWNDFAISNSTAYRYVRIGISGTADDGDVRINEVRVRGLATGTYTVTFQGSLANMNIEDWTTVTSGYITNTQTQGSGGTGPEIPTGPFLQPDHRRVYLATDDDDLAEIDTASMPDNYGVGGDAHLLASAYASGYTFGDWFNVFYSFQGLRHATDFVPGAQNVSSYVTMPVDFDSLSDCEWLEKTADGCAATGFWISYRDVCGGFEMWVDIYVTRTEAPGYGADNDVDSRTFTFGRAINPSGEASLRITLILPNT